MTHLASPYRVPVWTELIGRWSLEINVVESSLSRFGAENRGDDWLPQQLPGIGLIYLKTFLLRHGRAAIHVLKPFSPRSRLGQTEVLLLGGWEAPVYWYFLILARLRGRPVVGFYESTRASQRYTKGLVAAIKRHIFQSFDAMVVPGAAAAEAVLDLGVKPERLFIGFNAVDVSQIALQADAERVRGLDVEESRYRIVFVGQLVERKRIRELVNAVLELNYAHLTVVGVGPLDQELRSMVRAAGAESRVHFVGLLQQEDLISLLARHSTLCLPSSEEVWGLVVNEALACGLQVIVSERCGVAASIRSMEGVYILSAITELPSLLETAMRSWSGPIASPEILRYTPRKFAGVFDSALRYVLKDR